MKKSTGYIWAILMLLTVLVVDAYYQVMEAAVPIWQTEWFWWRAAGLFVILLIVFLYFLYKSSVKRKRELAQIKIKLMEAQEAEWKRLAGELHDSVGQNLSAINIYLQQNIKTLPDGAEEKENLRAASEMLVETLEEVRRISTKLFPQQIEKLGLTVAMQSMVSKLEVTTGLNFKLNIDNIDALFAKDTEIYFYRIMQEALNNIIKHAEAKNITIAINKALMFVTVLIEDDGKGFDTSKIRASRSGDKLGFGLLNLDERIRLIKGTYKFSAPTGGGTRLQITIPAKDL